MATAPALPLDVDATLYSGQSFRWRRDAAGWHDGFVRNVPVRVRSARGGLEWDAAPGLGDADVRRYFRLDGSHDAFLAEVRRDEVLDRALGAFPGLRVLVQDPWEIFVDYIVSANSNISKISRTLEAVCRLAGEPIAWRGATARRFPTPEALARLTEAELRSTGMGYRAPYLRAAARLVAEGDLDPHALARMPYAEAHARLVEVPGVGDKVADCILLYGCGHVGAFPVDVWMARVVREAYFPRRRLNHRQIGEWARDHFGPWAGYAQHYLFHYRRAAGEAPLAAASQATRRRAAVRSASRRRRATRGNGGKSTPS